MKQKAELIKLELQNKKLSLIQEGRLLGSGDDDRPATHFDIVSNLCLLPKFNEKDPHSLYCSNKF